MSRDEEPHNPLDLLPYALRVGEFIHDPGVLDHWRQKCHESYEENRQRSGQHQSWKQQLEEYVLGKWRRGVAPGQEPPKEGFQLATVREISGDKVLLAHAWVPPELGADQEPYSGGPLPFSRKHLLSLPDCYFILALIHDDARRDAHRITPFDPEKVQESKEDTSEAIIWITHFKRLANLRLSDKVTLDECLRRVETDVKTVGVRAETTEQYVTLDQMAALVNRRKRTLERYMNKPNTDMPAPDVEGGGGKPHEWKWSKVRPWLEKQFERQLHERFQN